MSSKIERLLYTRKRLATDLNTQTSVISAFSEETSETVILARKEALESLWEELKNNTEMIEGSRDWIGTDEFIQESTKMHEAYINGLVTILRLMPDENEQLQNSMRSGRNPPRYRPTDQNEFNESTASTTGLPLTIKLPPLHINKFSGKLIDWPEFKATCESTFTEIRNKIQQFRCLKSYLEGEPFDMVKHLPATDQSYEEAWLILMKRYDNERAIINSHIKNLLDLPSLTTESSNGLKIMLNTTNECIAALKSYKIDTSSWNAILIVILSQRLDPNSVKHWEEKIQGCKTIPTLSTFFDFLEIRINILEITTNKRVGALQDIQKHKKQNVLINYDGQKRCTICQGDHFAYVCAELMSKPSNEKIAFIEGKNLCTNCFHTHRVADCTSRFSCKICKQRHNSVLHESATVFTIITNNENETTNATFEPEELQAREMAQSGDILETAPCFSLQARKENHVILATAIIKIEVQNRIMLVKALIDQGSTTNLISKNICRALDMQETNTTVPITGVCGQVSYNVTKQTSFLMRSMINNDYAIDVNALIVPRIATLKSATLKTSWTHLKGLSLADSQMHETNRIDVLLGASVFTRIILNGLIKGKIGQPIAQRTELGWIISGDTEEPELHQQIVPIFTILTNDQNEDELTINLQRFWEIEEIPKRIILTVEEQQAEDHYKANTTRHIDGRFMVKLPFKKDASKEIGNSFPIAKRRFDAMVKRFTLKPDFRAKYDQCIREYLDLNHMEPIDMLCQQPKFYLPHHPVIKESSSTTKIRPVFDASCRSNNNISLNSELLVGPTIQPDLFSLITKWRKFKFAVTGDIEKMYRQIWIDPNDSMYQCIVWKPDVVSDLKSYSLKTVTFGVASAPFLAIRSLYEIGENIKNKQPELAEKIQTNFYVDDFFDSAETVQKAQSIIKEITSVLSEYGFQLRKWKTNDENIAKGLQESEKDKLPCNIFKTLGVQWHSESDCFVFVPYNLSSRKEWTKRTVLSEICKLFDPLGWISPSIITAKIFIQKLWLFQLGWDESLPTEITDEWNKIRTQFASTCSVNIPRWIGLSNAMVHVSLQGFADASERAYACVVYMRVQYENGSISSELLAAKTRVAPLKKVSIPRLELNAALLLSELMNKLKDALKIPSLSLQAWSDSAITLYWIADHPSRWKTYVANRVSEIQKTLPSHLWRHIESAQNPADCASRGLNLVHLEQLQLWWKGPKFLISETDKWPERVIIQPTKILEEKRNTIVAHVTTFEPHPIISRVSNFTRLLRITALCLRWLIKIRSKLNKNITKGNLMNISSKPFDIHELQAAENHIIRSVQEELYSTEISLLSKGKKLPLKNALINLDPFVDSDNILRVGGRIQNSLLSNSEKYPIILPAKHHFTLLLVQYAHKENLHGGIGITLNWIRRKYWIISGRQVVKSIIFKCVTCFRFRKDFLTQKMGNLPIYRTQKALPFTYTGVDYAGYFEVKTSSRKNAPYTKAYISVFICLTTRAIHLELVSDLSTTQFLKAFKRFIGRRGFPSEVYSDNGCNFIGADREIRETFQKSLNQNDSEVNEMLLKNHIKWKTIPARAPHFGGWESSVKSVKYHLKRVLGNVRLTFEDFNTLIIQIEAVINSRPLWSNPTNTDEYEALTPAHFLIFRPMNMLPELSTDHLPLNRLSQYQYLQRLLTDFWKLWSTEYLQTLQVRKKWKASSPNVMKGQIVLISEDNESPMRWSLGKITQTFKGTDDLVRVAEVQCRGKLLRRPIHKLSLLPITDNYNINC